MARYVVVGLALTGLTSVWPLLAEQPREFANVKQLGAALVEYHDGRTQAVAAYYYSQRHHDAPWLLVELGVASTRTIHVRRDRINLETPSRDVVPVATQRRWSDDAIRARALLQNAAPTRHQIHSYFRGTRGAEPLRLFGRPEDGQTVIDALESAPEQVLLGDLLFESPTGAWERGTYRLVIGHDTGRVDLPIELR